MTSYWLRHRGTLFPVLQGDCLLGRSPGCLIVLPSERVSRERSARIAASAGPKLDVVPAGARSINPMLYRDRDLAVGQHNRNGGRRIRLRARKDITILPQIAWRDSHDIPFCGRQS